MKNNFIKLLASLFFSFCVAFSQNLHWIYILPIVFVLFIEKKHLLEIIKKLVLVNFFIIFLVVFVMFHDVQQGIILLLRTNIILLFNIALFYESKGYDLVRGLNTMHLPKKFISTFYFTVVMIEYLFKEIKMMKTTLKLRGFSAKTDMFSYQIFGNLFAMMFIKAIKKSEDMSDNLKTRNFHGEVFLLNDNSFTKYDSLLLILVFLTIITQVVYSL